MEMSTQRHEPFAGVTGSARQVITIMNHGFSGTQDRLKSGFRHQDIGLLLSGP